MAILALPLGLHKPYQAHLITNHWPPMVFRANSSIFPTKSLQLGQSLPEQTFFRLAAQNTLKTNQKRPDIFNYVNYDTQGIKFQRNTKPTKILSAFGDRGPLAWSTFTHGCKHCILHSIFLCQPSKRIEVSYLSNRVSEIRDSSNEKNREYFFFQRKRLNFF